MNRLPVLIVLAALTFAPSALEAKSKTPLELLDEARAAAKGDDAGAAAKAFGKAARAAHKGGDLVAERAIGDALSSFLRRLPPNADGKQISVLDAVESVLAGLDRKRTSAFVSVPALGLDALYVATETGDATRKTNGYVIEWAKSKAGKGSRAAAPIGEYAAAMKALRQDAAAGAPKPAEGEAAPGESERHLRAREQLIAAQTAAAELGFAELLAHINTESVVCHLEAGLEAEAWEKLKGRSPIVSVSVDEKGFVVVPRFKQSLSDSVPFKAGPQARKVAGLHLLLIGRAFALTELDMTGREALHGYGARRSKWSPLHLVAEGETVTLSKKSGFTYGKR